MSDTVSSDFPLVAAAQRLGGDVGQVLLPDLFVPPAATQPLITATSTVLHARHERGQGPLGPRGRVPRRLTARPHLSS